LLLCAGPEEGNPRGPALHQVLQQREEVREGVHRLAQGQDNEGQGRLQAATAGLSFSFWVAVFQFFPSQRCCYFELPLFDPDIIGMKLTAGSGSFHKKARKVRKT
jgi:hypothetical protein